MTYQLTFTGDEVQSRLAQGFEETPSGIWRHREHGGVWWRKGLNQLVRVTPTLIAAVSGPTGGQSVAPSADWVSTRIDARLFCPASGRRAFVGAIGDPANDYTLAWSDQPSRTFLGTDVLMLTVWLPMELPSDNPPAVHPVATKVVLRVSPDTTVGANYREFIATGYELMPGWQTITLRWDEDQLTDGQTTVGTREWEPDNKNQWRDYGSANVASAIRSYSISIRDSRANAEVRVGSLLTAPDLWAVSAFNLGFDDCWSELNTYTIPAVEARGWRVNMPVIGSWTADQTGPSAMTLAQVMDRARQGHSVSAHTWFHNGVVDQSLTEAQMLDDYTRMRDFWRSKGLTDASTTMMWPRGEVTEQAAAIMAGLGYVWAGGPSGNQNPYTPGAGNPMSGPRMPMELGVNTKWEMYSRYNGMILRGLSVAAVGHQAVSGGASTDAMPVSKIQHYREHFPALLDILQAYEQSGRCVVVGDPMDTYRLAGHDPAGEWVA